MNWGTYWTADQLFQLSIPSNSHSWSPRHLLQQRSLFCLLHIFFKICWLKRSPYSPVPCSELTSLHSCLGRDDSLSASALTLLSSLVDPRRWKPTVFALSGNLNYDGKRAPCVNRCWWQVCSGGHGPCAFFSLSLTGMSAQSDRYKTPVPVVNWEITACFCHKVIPASMADQ